MHIDGDARNNDLSNLNLVTLYRYGVQYRRDLSGRVWHVTVTATSPDDARRRAAILDPLYLVTVRTPQRRALVTP